MQLQGQPKESDTASRGRSGSQEKTEKMTTRVVLNIFLVAETKPDKSNVRKEGFVSVHGSRESGPPWREATVQDQEAISHIAATVRQQCVTNAGV